MRDSKAETVQKTHHLLTLKFEDQQLTSFSGRLLLQQLFDGIDLREKMRRCFRHLRDMRYHADDPIVQRTVGRKRLPAPSLRRDSLRRDSLRRDLQ